MDNQTRLIILELIDVVEGLSAQQAMSDDWYEAPLAKAKKFLEDNGG